MRYRRPDPPTLDELRRMGVRSIKHGDPEFASIEAAAHEPVFKTVLHCERCYPKPWDDSRATSVYGRKESPNKL